MIHLSAGKMPGAKDRQFHNVMNVGRPLQNYRGFNGDPYSGNADFGSMTPLRWDVFNGDIFQYWAFNSSGTFYLKTGDLNGAQNIRCVFPDGRPINVIRSWWSRTGPPLTDDAGLFDMTWNGSDSRYAVSGRIDLWNFLNSILNQDVSIYLEGVS